MFDPKKEVPSLELCKRLKELGYPQDGGSWYWDLWPVKPRLVFLATWENFIPLMRKPKDKWLMKAPTLREIIEWLPLEIEYEGETLWLDLDRPDESQFIVSYCRYCDGTCPIAIGDDDIVNAPTKMLIWLAKNGYVKFKGDNA